MNICIVGGGTAGWMTASYLASVLPNKITLIESKDIPIIGVGESTVPSFTDFIETVGLTEQDLFNIGSIRKYSAKHCDWPEKGKDWHHYFIFDKSEQQEQMQWLENIELPNKHWRHSYHIDATKFSNLLRERFKDKIDHNYDTIEHVECADNSVKKLVGKQREYTADLFIDCSGLNQLLLKNFTNTTESNKSLINNKAWAGHADYTEKAGPVYYTGTYAMDYGWQWNICLQDRAGCGYVFSDKHCDSETAKQEFINKCPFKLREDSLKLIDFKSKWNKRPWCANVLAVGLSAGFLEPLESQSIFLTQMQIHMLHRLISKDNSRNIYNRFWNIMIRHIAKYLELHYTLSSRTDTTYWNSFKKTNTVLYNHSYSPLFHEYGHMAIAEAYGANLYKRLY